jgi:hypothetical protein
MAVVRSSRPPTETAVGPETSDIVFTADRYDLRLVTEVKVPGAVTRSVDEGR